MDYTINLTVVKDIKITGQKIGGYWYDKDLDVISFQLPYPFSCKFAIVGLDRILVTPMMLKLPSVFKYHNIDFLRQQLMQVKCIENDAVLLHGAAWKKAGIGYLAVGFTNSGKTTRVVQELTDGTPADFCSDENVIVTQDRLILPVDRLSSLNRRLLEDIYRPLGEKLKRRLFWAELRSWLCPLFEPNIWIKLPFERRSFYLDKLIYLNPGVKSLALLTDNEFPFYTNPVLQTYAYITGWDLDGVYAKYRGLLKNIEGINE